MDRDFHLSTGQSNPIASSQSSMDGTSVKNASDSATEVKLRAIREACKIKDLEALADLATSRLGLVFDEVRRETWPILLGVDEGEDGSEKVKGPEDLAEHRAEHQVQLDVDRSFVYYPANLPSKELDKRKEQLSDVINQVLRHYPFLHYFQGFHDICQVFLLVLGPQLATSCVTRLCLTRIRDFMLSSLTPALVHLHLLPDILQAEDGELCRHLSDTQPFFALAATLTLFAHDIQDYKDIARLFDALLAREPVFSIYLFATIIIWRRSELLEIPPDEPEMLYSILCKLPQRLDLDKIIVDAVVLQAKHPPVSLRSWRKISSYSVLKTARSATQAASQASDDGIALFHKQAAQLRFSEFRQDTYKLLSKYKRPATTISLAVFVGLLSWWMSKSGTISKTVKTAARYPPTPTAPPTQPVKIVPASKQQLTIGARVSGNFLPPPVTASSSSSSSKRYLWTLSFYAQFFDVDTAEVLRRCATPIFPRGPNFLDVLDGNPDLYGPFWIATTVVMILFLTGTISLYLSRKGEGHFAYDFRLLSGAAGLIYGYTGIIPIALWGALKWFGSESANLLECLALYGYANIIWIPVALISWSPITILNMVFVGIGFVVSALFLFRNLNPVLSATDAKTSKVLLILVVALHAGLAIAVQILFFAHGSPATKKGKNKDGG
ncbi:MAG: hypothetical protein M1816_006327 [Peltula sp. TS41687]|nr:MAG: hypothetical protein M1816_006327 [Peltula sp. TS41687]